MLTTQNIKEKLAGKEVAGQLAELDAMLGRSDAEGLTAADKALILAEKGKLLWALDKRGEALSAYEQGAQLDPDGPAALLLAHSNDIMRFFNPDILNP